jgi:hypothetical protein
MAIDINVDHTPEKSFTTLATGVQLKLTRKTVEVNGVRGTTGRSQAFIVINVGNKAFTLGTDAFTITGTDAEHFSVVGGSLPRRVSTGKRAQFFVALTPKSDAPTNRVLTAFLDIKPVGESAPLARIALRGIATTGEGEDKEPSLARLMELFQYSINVGDTSPNTTFLDLNGGATDEIFAPRFQMASEAPVTVTPIAQFAPKTNTVAGRFGYYVPGLPSARTQLLELAGADGQSVNPSVNGATTFNPGASPFSLWAEAPEFVDDDHTRIIYGEDALNTWEPDGLKRRKVRVYGLNENGRAVANAYVVAFEEYPPQNDQNDYVFVIRNVKTVTSRPVLGFVSIDGIEDPRTLAFNRIEFENQTIGNDVHDTSRVRLVNTGNKDLLIYSLSIIGEDAAAFSIIGGPSGATTIARGASLDVTVRFNATSGDLSTAFLTVESNDKQRRYTSLKLNGFWQSHSEMNAQNVSQEPSLAEIFRTFGFGTVAVSNGQDINTKGAPTPVGDEVLNAYWKSADASRPVSIRQIAGFHQQGTSSEVAWYQQGKPFYYPSDPRYPGASANGDQNTLFRTNINDGQSLYQRKQNSTDPARSSFTTNTTFGFRIDGEFSDDSLNNRVTGDEGAHHMRFYPLRDAGGNFVPNSYLMTMDFASINFDYNDNIFVISNIRPSDRTGAVEGLAGVQQNGSIALDWSSTVGAASYKVMRSNQANGSYQTLTISITDSFFVDGSARGGRSWYYRVIAIDAQGDESTPAATRVYLNG